MLGVLQHVACILQALTIICMLTKFTAGGGKSMTFQLPALAKGNCFTVVVGPLMALAKDQVMQQQYQQLITA